MKINFVGDGDSIMYGYLALPNSLPVQLLALLEGRGDGNTYTIHNIGVNSTTLPEIDSRFAANAATLYDPTADRNIYMLWAGGNDLHFGFGLAPAKAAHDSIVSKAVAAGFEVLNLNIIQRGNAGGTLARLNTWRAEADLLNAYMWANPAVVPVDAKSCWQSFDWAIDPWQSVDLEVQRSPEYSDWAHPSASGHAPVAAMIALLVAGEAVNYGIKTTTGLPGGAIKMITGLAGGVPKHYSNGTWI